ncbi:MAG: mechanosensitive ion channel family protein [Planctomycetota bacterium]
MTDRGILSIFINIIEIFIITACGIGTGYLIEKIIIGRLRRKSKETPSEIDDIIINSLSNIVIIITGAFGFYIASNTVRIPEFLKYIFGKIALIVSIISLTIFLVRIGSGFLEIYITKVKDVIPYTSLFRSLLKLILLSLGIIIILQSIGISVVPILTTLGIGGLAIALAFQETLANLFSGFYISISKHIRPGDFIKLENGPEGFVEDITWRYTTIRTRQNNIVVIPNSKLASSIITNYYLPGQELGIVIPVGVCYGSDLQKVEGITKEVAREIMQTTEGGIPEVEPIIRYTSFGDSSINFNVILRIKNLIYEASIKHEFIKKLYERYVKEGIGIPFPTRTVYLKQQPD